MKSDRMKTGIAGMDKILVGGLLGSRSYLVRGDPGCGKTTFGLHFLEQGAKAGDAVLMITFSQSEQDLREDAAGMGISLENIDILDLSPNSDRFAGDKEYTVFSASEVEAEGITKRVIEELTQKKPTRVCLDSVTSLQFLQKDDFKFRQQLLSLMRLLKEQKITSIFCSESSALAPDQDVQFICDGVFTLSRCGRRRMVEIEKYRGSDFQGGIHDLVITDRGLVVYPRLVLPAAEGEPILKSISCGAPGIDRLMGGGLPKAAMSILSGPSGIGKTTLGLLFMKEAAGRGERSVVFTFEEVASTLVKRAESINIPVGDMIEGGKLSIIEARPLQYSINEFMALVQEEVEERDASIIMVDSLAGLRLCVDEADIMPYLYTLSRYLTHRQVSGILINEVESVTGDFHPTECGVSHVCDCIVYFRYLEWRGELRRAIGMLKKRTGNFEKCLRQFTISQYGVQVGDPMHGLHGLLTGKPELAEDADGISG